MNPPGTGTMADDDGERLLQRAVESHQAGRLDEAESAYRRVLAVQPENPAANHNLAVLTVQSGKGLAVALPLFAAAWNADPAHQQHWLSYLKALIGVGDTQTAAAVHGEGTRRGLRGPSIDALTATQRGRSAAPARAVPPASPSASAPRMEDPQMLARLFGAGRLVEAEQLARDLTVRFPNHWLGWKALGAALGKLGRLDEAVAPLERTTQLAPNDPEAFVNLGMVRLDLGVPMDAERAFRRAIAINADHAAAHKGLATALLRLHRPNDAEQSCRKALQLAPGLADAHRLLGDIEKERGLVENARASYRQALALQPNHVLAYNALGQMLYEDNLLAEAEALCRQFLLRVPNHFDSLLNLGKILTEQGRLGEAAEVTRQALSLQPDSIQARSVWLFASNYLASEPPDRLLAEAAQFGRYASALATAPYSTWLCAEAPARLKVGIVSGDLCEHPVGYFLEGVLANSDSSRVEWIAYPTRSRTDALTARLRRSCSGWHSLAGLTDRLAAETIRGDGVHVLLDLSGHTAFGRLPVFAWRPAPIQASWLGYFATTGMAEIDYFIADEVGVPPPSRRQFTETIWYLPDTRLCFSPPVTALEPAGLPALRNGRITFGCFQNLPKINDGVLGAWSRIMASCPTARLRLQTGALSDAAVAESLVGRMQASGIDPGRVSLHGSMPREQYLAAHAEVDIVLDSFPYPGGTTTCEALWMGVPTVTLAGETLLARQGASLLTAAGLSDWIADSVDRYVALACERAADPARLASLRASLRAQVARSPLFDAPRFARKLEAALWAMWAARTA